MSNILPSAEIELARIGSALREHRKNYKITQEQLASLVGVSDRTVREVEKGTGSVSARTFIQLISAVGLSIKLESREIDTIERNSR